MKIRRIVITKNKIFGVRFSINFSNLLHKKRWSRNKFWMIEVVHIIPNSNVVYSPSYNPKWYDLS